MGVVIFFSVIIVGLLIYGIIDSIRNPGNELDIKSTDFGQSERQKRNDDYGNSTDI